MDTSEVRAIVKDRTDECKRLIARKVAEGVDVYGDDEVVRCFWGTLVRDEAGSHPIGTVAHTNQLPEFISFVDGLKS